MAEKENLLDAQYSPLSPPSSRKYSGEPQLERSGRSELPPPPCHTFSNETPHMKFHLTELLTCDQAGRPTQNTFCCKAAGDKID